MNKQERVQQVLNGNEVDRPPLSLWYHFGIQHSGGEQFARTSLEYFNYYDFDFYIGGFISLFSLISSLFSSSSSNNCSF